MRSEYFYIVCTVALLLFTALTWLGPRYLGIWGLLIAQFLIAVGCFALFTPFIGRSDNAFIAILLVLGGIFLLNSLLFPVGLLSLRRRRRVARRRVEHLIEELKSTMD